MGHDDCRQAFAGAARRQGQIGRNDSAVGCGEGHRFDRRERDLPDLAAHRQHFLQMLGSLVEQVEHAGVGVTPGKQQQFAFVLAGIDDIDVGLARQGFAKRYAERLEFRIEVFDRAALGCVTRSHHPPVAPDRDEFIDIDIAARQYQITLSGAVQSYAEQSDPVLLVVEAKHDVALGIDRNRRETAAVLADQRNGRQRLPIVRASTPVIILELVAGIARGGDVLGLHDPNVAVAIGQVIGGLLVRAFIPRSLQRECVDQIDAHAT